ncbi:IS4 family transposase, partial [Streptomyces sp. NPDC002742]|uniref:IS4 family transposase n=1 Tax=Streptomyces sp. NPDC002742 TaxID=3364663 RepID=UPI0036BBCD3F
MPTHAPAAESVSASQPRASRYTPVAGQLTLGAVTEIVPPALIDEVITRCGRRERRIRMLPARVTLYLVLALWLYPNVGYREVLRMLFEQLHHRAGTRHLPVPSAPAAVQARRRLGREPLKSLFLLLRGAHCGPEDPGATAFGHDLALLTTAVDGTTLDVPDTVPNRAAFGPAPGRSNKDPGRCPQIRVLTLIACGTRAILDAAWGGRSTSEGALLRKLVHGGCLRAGMLVLADRYFSGSAHVATVRATGADLIIRAIANRRLPVLRRLPDGSYLSHLPAANQITPDLIARARAKGVRPQRRGVRARQDAGMPIRVIQADITVVPEHGESRSESYLLITTLFDHVTAPALQIVKLYAERWEAETGYADLKIHLSGMRNVLRSAEPNGVAQELYALLIVYQIVQIIRARAARENHDDAPVDPDRISFTVTLRALVRSVGRGTPPALLDVFHEIWSSPRLERRGRTKTRERKGTLAYARAVSRTPLSRAEYKITIQAPQPT